MRVDEKSVKEAVEVWKQEAFAVAYYLLGNDCDRAYDAVAQSFAGVLRGADAGAPDLPARLFGALVARCRGARVIPSSDEYGLEELAVARRRSLLMVRQALQSLPFDERVLLLLRDQARLPYATIAAVMRMESHQAKARTFQARGLLRDRIAEMLNGA